MEYKNITVTYPGDRIAHMTLNRPERKNALSIAMRNEISACLKDLKDNPQAGLLVISGAGGSFCAGFDLKDFKDQSLFDDIFTSSNRYHRDLWHFPKPVIAALEGHVLGGGFNLATLCDIRICSENTHFGHPEVKFGAPPFFTPLRWIIGHGMARDLCFTGRMIDAAEAHRMGLVSQVVTADKLLDRAMETARTILEAPAATLASLKNFVVEDAHLGFEESFVNEHDIPFKTILLKR